MGKVITGRLRWRLFRPGAGRAAGPPAIAYFLAYVAAVLFAHASVSRYGSVLIWPANGVLLAGILHLYRRQAAPLFAACVAVNLIGNSFRPGPEYMVWLYALLNAFEVCAVALLTRRLCGAALDLRRPLRLGRFVLFGVAPAVALAALVGVAFTPEPIAQHAVSLVTWFTVDSLGLLTFAPALLLLVRSHRFGGEAERSWPERIGLLALLAGVTVGVFSQSEAPVLFLVMLPLLLIAFRLSPPWAAAGVIVVAVIAGFATLNEHGPLMLAHVGPNAWNNAAVLPMLQVLPIYYLFLAAVICVALPASTLWTERRRNEARLRVRTEAATIARHRAEAAEQRIREAALHDAETGLPNRAGLIEATGDGHHFVAALAIERSAAIRTAIGVAGIAELVTAAARLVADTLPGAQVGRIAPDTLAVILPGADEAAARDRLDRLASRFEQPLAAGGDTVDVRLAIGLAAGGGAAALDHAQAAVEQARAAGLAFAAFDPAAEQAAAGGLALLSDLRAGLARGEVWLAYQPKLDCRTGTIRGAEALIRWTKAGVAIPPDRFIPVAEETGFIDPLTDWVLGRALAERSAFGPDFDIAINVSARSLSQPGYADRLIARADWNGAGLTLEVTETAIMADPAVALANLDTLRTAGFGVAIDDFGTGQSSLAYLRRIPADTLKIDQAFVTGLGAANHRDTMLVRAMIDLARSIGLKVVAEGVEDQATLTLLTLAGCDQAQGWHVGRPMPAADLAALVTAPPLAQSA